MSIKKTCAFVLAVFVHCENFAITSVIKNTQMPYLIERNEFLTKFGSHPISSTKFVQTGIRHSAYRYDVYVDPQCNRVIRPFAFSSVPYKSHYTLSHLVCHWACGYPGKGKYNICLQNVVETKNKVAENGNTQIQ